jgi:threonine dehydrogenase-like Zn-dependent dehydrogenase
VEYSFEAIGAKPTAEQAYRMLALWGTATIIGMGAINEPIAINDGYDALQHGTVTRSVIVSTACCRHLRGDRRPSRHTRPMTVIDRVAHRTSRAAIRRAILPRHTLSRVHRTAGPRA